MKETAKLAFILFLITAISAFILSVSNKVTEPIIAEANELKNEEAKIKLLNKSKEFKDLDDELLDVIKSKNANIVQCDEGLSDGEVVGYVFQTSTPGYKGYIEFMIGISIDGKVEGIEILNHEETPGLGANIIRPSFKTSFEGKTIANGLSAVKEPSREDEVQAITSATITTDAVVDEVNRVIDAYKELDKSLDESSQE